MNAELQRNVWLELTPRRLVQMVVAVGLILLVSNTTGRVMNMTSVAQFLFYAIVVVWGARDAAQSVVGEIRERTWDSQRLSALTPFEITWGKLLGATSYVWFGGAICLAVLIGLDMQKGDVPHAVTDLFYYIGIGLFAQATAMFASLVAVRRRQTRTRFNVFQYQATGVAAAGMAWWGWALVNPILDRNVTVRTVDWWNMTIDARNFFLASLGAFLFWVLLACYRLMRQELQVPNRPTVWLAFIVFMASYMAGFDLSGLGFDSLQLPGLALVVQRLLLADYTLVVLTYIAVLFEPKDSVLYRWLGDMARKGRLGAVASRLQCWMIAYAAAMVCGAVLLTQFDLGPESGDRFGSIASLMVAARLGYLTRDIGIVMFFGLAPGQNRGDMPAVITLGILYLLLPRLSFGPDLAQWFYGPFGIAGFNVLYPWIEAAVLWFIVIATRARRVAPLQPKASASA